MPRILVADDNTNIQKMVSLALQELGVEVTSVSNGEAAVRRLPSLNPDLILADIFMPVRNGYELCEWVKTDSKYSHIPVILLVGAFDPLDEKEARRVGADGILKKPFIPPDPLIAMVTSTLEKNSRAEAGIASSDQVPAAAPSSAAPTGKVAVEAKVAGEAENGPHSIATAPADDAALEYGFGLGSRDMRGDEREDSAPAGAPGADFSQPADDESEESSAGKGWRPSTIPFEVPEQHSQISPSPTGGRASSGDGHASRIQVAPNVEPQERTLPADSSSEFFEEVPGTNLPAPAEVGELERQVDSKANLSAPAPEPSFASKSSHWMDLMSSTVAQPAQRDWLSSISAQAPEQPSEQEVTNSASPVNSDVSSTIARDNRESADLAAESSGGSSQSAGSSEEDWFFADEAAAPGATDTDGEEQAGEPPRPSVQAPNPVHADWQLPRQAESSGKSEEAVSRADACDLEPETSTVQEEVSKQTNVSPDPRLIEPLPVRPAPEPLLIDESPAKSLDYESRDQEVPPAFSFLPEVEKNSSTIPGPPALEPEEASAPHISYEEQERSAAEEPRADTLASESRDSHAVEVSAPAPFGEQVPTASAPSREDLAGIPFLNPPSDFDREEEAENEDGAAADSIAVEDVVDRVLSKIEPQLRSLLSENLKPLIENLIQDELQKKER